MNRMASRRILEVISLEYLTPWKMEVDFIGALHRLGFVY